MGESVFKEDPPVIDCPHSLAVRFIVGGSVLIIPEVSLLATGWKLELEGCLLGMDPLQKLYYIS